MVKVTVLLGTVILVPVSVTVAQFMFWYLTLGGSLNPNDPGWELCALEDIVVVGLGCDELHEGSELAGGKNGALSLESGLELEKNKEILLFLSKIDIGQTKYCKINFF